MTVDRTSVIAQTSAMRLTVEIDDDLMREAMEVSGLSKRATIEAALRLLISTEQRRLSNFRGIGGEADLDGTRD